MNCTYIKNKKKLEKAYNHLNKCKVIGVDIECENNFHHFGAYISLIQMSSLKKTFVIDVLFLKNIGYVLNILKNHYIEKIFHGCDFDLRMIYTEFNCRIKNIFDTQIAAQLLGFQETGLGSLLENFLDIHKKDRFQHADWTRRPLKKKMLDYAAKDSMYLIELSNILKQKLKQINRLSWAKQEAKYMIEKDNKLSQPVFWDFRGLSQLTDQERAVLRELYFLREKMAEKTNRPVHYIMNSKKLKNLSVNPVISVKKWKNMKGVHPVVKQKAEIFSNAVKKGLKKRIKLPDKKYKRYSPKQRKLFEKLDKLRKKISEKLEIEPFLIMSKDQIKEIVLSDSYESLRPWQKKLVQKEINI
jgi:ribonuclease D